MTAAKTSQRTGNGRCHGGEAENICRSVQFEGYRLCLQYSNKAATLSAIVHVESGQ